MPLLDPQVNFVALGTRLAPWLLPGIIFVLALIHQQRLGRPTCAGEPPTLRTCEAAYLKNPAAYALADCSQPQVFGGLVVGQETVLLPKAMGNFPNLVGQITF